MLMIDPSTIKFLAHCKQACLASDDCKKLCRLVIKIIDENPGLTLDIFAKQLQQEMPKLSIILDKNILYINEEEFFIYYPEVDVIVVAPIFFH